MVTKPKLEGSDLQHIYDYIQPDVSFDTFKWAVELYVEKQLQLACLDAKIEELSLSRNYHIDAGYSDHYHSGFAMALDQVTDADNLRIAELTAQKAHLTTKGGDES